MKIPSGKTAVSARARKVLSAVLLCGLGPLASAVPGPPLSCAEGRFGEGGCPPYAQVIFFGNGLSPPNSLFEYDEPVLDILRTGGFGTVRGVVDLPQALVKTYAQSNDDGNVSTNNGLSMNAVGVDLFTLRRLGSPSPDFFTFSVLFTANGIGGIDNVGYSVASYMSLRPNSINGATLGFSGGRLDHGSVLQAGNQVPVFQQFNVNLMTYANLSARLDQPFMLSYSLRTDVSERSFLDFLNSARISFLLPPDVTVTSMGGFNSAAVVPEPSTWLLMTAGLAGLARMARNRRRDV